MEYKRNKIYEENTLVLANVSHKGDQCVMRLEAPMTAKYAKPGQFVHLRVSNALPLRRPISIMQTDPEKGTIDLLYKKIGEGTKQLGERVKGEMVPLLGPIGKPFDLDDKSKRYVLIGGGVGVPPMIFVATTLAGNADVVLFAGSEVEFPFALKPSTFMLPGIEGNTTLTISSIEERGVPCRLASNAGLYGCFEGHVPELASNYLRELSKEEQARTVLLSCGPHPMLHAVANLGREFGIPAQLSLEEHMACGIGGCAGCVVKTVEDGKEKYRRVCVDGPVFASELLPEFS